MPKSSMVRDGQDLTVSRRPLSRELTDHGNLSYKRTKSERRHVDSTTGAIYKVRATNCKRGPQKREERREVGGNRRH